MNGSGIKTAFAIFLFSAVLVETARGKENNDVLFEANEVKRNPAAGYVDAIGDAQFQWRDYSLLADRVRYYEKQERIQAFGNITFADPTGVFWFAQKLTLEKGWQTGVLENLAALFDTGARLTARSAKRDLSPGGFGRRSQMRHASYSPCKVCKDEKNFPLWQISASKTTHYENSKMIYYNNVFLEFFGVPVFYLPFFAHPDPSVERRSGLLTPSIAYNSRLGGVIKTPFTINFIPQTSLVITPLITTKEGVQLQADWGHWTRFGLYHITASAAHDYDKNPDNEDNWPKAFRWHLFSDGDFTFNKQHTLQYNAQLASDDVYLDFFNVSSRTFLNSNISYQWHNDFASVALENYYIKDLVDVKQRPDLFVLPHLAFAFTPALLGGQVFIEGDLLHLVKRRQSTTGEKFSKNTKALTRASTTIGWQDEWHVFGNAIKLYAYGRYDFYHRRNFTTPKETNISRFLGLGMLEWRYPLLLSSDVLSSVIEPRVQFIYAPYKGKQPIPDEDSKVFYFSESNLFTVNRFAGLDRWESGPRANVGFSWTLFSPKLPELSSHFIFGKVFRLRKSQDFDTLENDKRIADKQGIADKDSDFVLSWELAAPYVEFSQNFRLDRNRLDLRRYDTYVKVSAGWFALQVNYALDKSFTNPRKTEPAPPPSPGLTDPRETEQALSSRATLNFTDNWSVFGGMRYDLERGNLLNYHGGLAYNDECFTMNIDFSTRKNPPKEGEPVKDDIRVGFRLTFTTLGTVAVSSSGENYAH